METIEARFDAFSGAFEALELVGLMFLVLIIGETVWDVVSRARRGYKETVTNFVIAVGGALLERTLFGLAFVVGLIIAESFAFTRLPLTWWSWVLAFVVADFSYYWMHRWEHEVRLLWAHHSVHHSSPEFNLTTALRLSWVEGVIEWLFFVPMVLMGFGVVQTLIVLSANVTYQTWIHTQKIGRLGVWDKIINTPSVHRVHHSSNEEYLDKNYGGVLMIWDLMFGTYQAETEKPVYGITKPLKSANPITINFYEYGAIIRDVCRAPRLKDAFGYVFARPGWAPSAGKRKSLKIDL